jgi:hypothetical protein
VIVDDLGVLRIRLVHLVAALRELQSEGWRPATIGLLAREGESIEAGLGELTTNLRTELTRIPTSEGTS